MSLNTDDTLNKIKQVNQRLSDLCELPYTDFFEADNFVRLFDLSLDNHPKYSTIAELVLYKKGYEIFNRITFIQNLCAYINFVLTSKELKLDIDDIDDFDKVIRAIQREFNK